MRAVRELRPPGVYPAAEELRTKPLTVSDTRIPGFVGLAARGPMNEPRLVGGWNEFTDVYGFSKESYLAHAVEGFFLNGGRSCYIVRVAHNVAPGRRPGPEHAACAERILKDGWDKPTLAVRALNEGQWGNSIWVRAQQNTAAKTLLTLDLDVGIGEARINSAKGFERGALVRIYDRDNSDYIILTEVEDRVIRWNSSTPVVRRYRAASPTFLEVLEFELYAALRDRREVFRNLQLSPLSRRYVGRVVNDESQLIRVENLRSTAPLPKNLPLAGPAAKLAGGRDGVHVLTADDFIGRDNGPADRRGLMALGSVESVAALAVPDAMMAYRHMPRADADSLLQQVQDAMINMAENLKDRFALLDLPLTKDLEEVRKWRRRYNTSFAAIYHPWLANESGAMIPPSGHIAGVIARCDTNVGVHQAPANEVLQGVTGLSIALSEDHLGLLTGDGINPIRSMPGRGVRIWGARTCSDDPDWRYVNVRRLFIMLRRSLEEGTQWTVFEPNKSSTWERLTREVSQFLKGLWEQGYFTGGAPESSFFVRCDEKTNPPDVRDSGQLIMDIGVAPTIPTEYMIFRLVQKIGEHTSDVGPSV